ncbi:unnamed protein product [Rotaria sp. Silwood1]|nr:unnamed protein product [Rotaria sp. Silwood1]CAF1124613.1 unnamed protein product [Rotaria sp. Silwood1]CAF1306497.1 unnamed protein product [Rotaria sp. Silwood1]CAF3438198.1 unnamed protein product [Rotaria sp. Silwood1]CAF3465446.1 unnamed protein product [Rotaria sp. Silwood1]
MVLHESYSYPIRGIFYLIRHPSLWRQLFCGLIIMLLVSIIASILLLVFAFPAQAYALSEHMASWISWIISFILTLFEIGIAVLLFSSLYLSYYMEIIFDAVVREETMIINHGETQMISSRTFSCIKSFIILIIFRVILVVLTCPLNIIPILGTILYIYINGYYYAWSLHCRYFDLIGLTFAQGKHYVEENRSDYTRFGIVAVLFEMIPFLNLITPITNIIGSALWACDIERFKEPLRHPRSYLLSPSPALVEQGQADYGTNKYEKDKILPPSYQDAIDNNIYPSAPPNEKQ